MRHIEFEKATKVELIISLLSELYLELGEEAESISYLTTNLVKDILQSGKTEIYLIKCDKAILGIFSLTESQAIYSGGYYGSLDEMYIKPEYRNNGIGKIGIQKIRMIAKEKGWKRVDVTTPTEKKWETTINFYRNCDFAFTGSKFKLQI